MADQSATKFDVKVWLAGILLVVGFVAGMLYSNSTWSTEATKTTQLAKAADDKINEAMGVLGSSKSFIVTVKAKNAAVFDETLKTLSVKAQKDLAKLLETAKAPAAK